MQNFEQYHQKIISPERWLIDHSEGAVFAYASSQSNIAELASLRIQKILLTAPVLPENIFCFTSTVKSSFTLLNHLQNLTIPDASRINIYTFPKFCQQLLHEESLCKADSMLPVSTLESIGLFKKLITALPSGNPLKRYRSDVFHEIKNLMALFSLMKREALSTKSLTEKIDALEEKITNSNKANTPLQIENCAEEKMMIEKLRAGITEFDHYQQLLKINNRYDSDDLASLALNALEENPLLLLMYRQKCKYILVNDYDSMGHEDAKMIQLLTAANDHPNILLISYTNPSLPVADPIYKKPWPTLPDADSAKWTMVALNEQISYSPSLQDTEKSDTEQSIPEIKEYHSQREEIAGITIQVKQLILAEIDPEKIAVCYQSDIYCDQLEQYFNLKKIPFFSHRDKNILEDPFIGKIIQLLHYINAEHDMPFSADELLFEILHFNFFKIPPIEIARLAIEAGNKKSNKGKAGIRKLLLEKSNKPPTDLFDTGIHTELKYASCMLEKLITDILAVSLQQVFKTVTESTWLQNYITQSNESDWLIQLLTALTDWLKKEITHNPGLQLSQLVTAIDTMQKEHLPITVNKVTGNSNAVHLVKESFIKNNKFNYIFFAMGSAMPKVKISWLSYIYTLPGIILPALAVADIESLGSALPYYLNSKNAYHLFISFIRYDSNGIESAIPSFIKKIAAAYSIAIEPGKLNTDELEEYWAVNKISLPKTAYLEETLIAPILNKFVLSVSALNNYLECPLGFYYKNIIRTPSRKNEAMEFGSAIHYSLEKLFKNLFNGSSPNAQGESLGEFTAVINLVKDFKQYLQSRRAHFTNEAFERRMEYGAEILRNYYNHYAQDWNKIVSVERNISGITINGVPVKGKLDKLEFNGKDVTIVDYKTGDINKAFSKMQPPNDNNPNGGDYWRQAVFYKLLVDNYQQKGWKVISTEFDFIEPDTNGLYHKEKMQIGSPDIETVKQQIGDVWAKIQRRDFYNGCGRQDCYWCNFVKNNNPAIGHHI